jgi:hypothetical protein
VLVSDVSGLAIVSPLARDRAANVRSQSASYEMREGTPATSFLNARRNAGLR